MTETVKIEDVSGPNERGWYEVVLKDGRKPNTNNEDVASAAILARGQDAEVEIGEQVKGNFTNLYLNKINGIGKAAPRRAGGASRSTSGGGDDSRQKRIAAQWAVGRVLENSDYTLPLSEGDAVNVAQAAKQLSMIADEVAKG